MRAGLQKKVNIAVAITVVLQIALITAVPALSYVGLPVNTGNSTIGKLFDLCFSRAPHCANDRPSIAPSKIVGALGLSLSSSSLRFDLKQNLSTWPVLSNGHERSPPLLLVR